MVGIVGILLLGSLAWSAVGALFSALGDATADFSSPRPTPARLAAQPRTPSPVVVVKPVSTPVAATTPPVATAQPTAVATLPPLPTAALTPTVGPSGARTPTPLAAGRAPWILLPQPE